MQQLSGGEGEVPPLEPMGGQAISPLLDSLVSNIEAILTSCNQNAVRRVGYVALWWF